MAIIDLLFFSNSFVEHCVVYCEDVPKIKNIENGIRKSIEDFDSVSLGDVVFKVEGFKVISPIFHYFRLDQFYKYIIIDFNKFIKNNCNEVGDNKGVFIEDPNFKDLIIFTNLND